MTETLLQQMVNDARDAYSTGSSVVRRGAAHVLALAAWQRDDVHDAMRWLAATSRCSNHHSGPRS